MRASETELSTIDGLVRVENAPVGEVLRSVKENTKDSYTHEEVYGDYCTLQGYVDAPPRDVYEYLADMKSQEEYTYSVRDLEPVDDTGLYVGWDRLSGNTRIYVRIEANPQALTVDYHAAWDQGDDLWMIYLFRVVDARTVLKRPGSVILWTNCHHPYYEKNPYPELAPSPDRPWVGDFWREFYAGHKVELENIKAIMEHRHHRGIPLTPSAAPGA
ncbi:SRPBCC family protein [Streptomyces longwoodensis]|uniref:SRPBCC family protein n=1 Tax=Streptomyces longwoodensis TaxID=68231 RepID=UPI00382C8C6C